MSYGIRRQYQARHVLLLKAIHDDADFLSWWMIPYQSLFTHKIWKSLIEYLTVLGQAHEADS